MHLEIFISLFTTALTVAPTSQIVGPTYFRTIVLPYTTYLLLLSIGNFVGSLPLSRKKWVLRLSKKSLKESDNGKDWEYLLPFHIQRERVEYSYHSVLWPWVGRYFLPVHIQKGETNSTQSILRHWIIFFPFLETGFENQKEKFESISHTAQ